VGDTVRETHRRVVLHVAHRHRAQVQPRKNRRWWRGEREREAVSGAAAWRRRGQRMAAGPPAPAPRGQRALPPQLSSLPLHRVQLAPHGRHVCASRLQLHHAAPQQPPVGAPSHAHHHVYISESINKRSIRTRGPTVDRVSGGDAATAVSPRRIRVREPHSWRRWCVRSCSWRCASSSAAAARVTATRRRLGGGASSCVRPQVSFRDLKYRRGGLGYGFTV
jgi:hypothetical protein